MADFQSELDTFTHFATNGFTLPPLIAPASDKKPSSSIGDTVAGVAGAIASPGQAMAGVALSYLFSSRVVAVLLGLILIAGSIYLFKPDAVNSAIAAVAA